MDTYEARAAQKLHAAEFAPKPAGIRPMEAVWALIALFLLMAWLDGGNLGALIVQERHEQVRYHLPLVVVKNCERNTKVAVAALNAWEITEGDVKVACKRVKPS